MDPSRPASIAPFPSELLVADERRSLKITLFPRRLLPGLVGWGIALVVLVVALVTLARPGEEPLARILAVACSAGFAVFCAHVPSRASFELDARGLRFEASPRCAASPLDLPLLEIEGVRVLTQGGQACVAILSRPGEIHPFRTPGMKRELADAIASTLQLRLDELREGEGEDDGEGEGEGEDDGDRR